MQKQLYRKKNLYGLTVKEICLSVCRKRAAKKTNIDIACKKLRDIILRSLEIPKQRKKTAPSFSEREERLSSKKKQSEKKQYRTKKINIAEE
jgi:hypothetical protein